MTLAAHGTPEALEGLHAQIRACLACPLSRTRIQAVPGDGPVTARIMAVGEAPGETEDRTGVPFVGAAGQVLTRLLQSVGLERSDLYICNVLKCRPPGNRDPLADEVEACAHFLDAQVELIRPDVILLLGRHALQRILPGAPGISRSHGTRIRDRGRLYVPLYHPAAALYNGSLMATLQDDMGKVRTYLDEAEAERLLVAQRAAQARAEADAADTAEATPHEQLSLF
jgi:uracil-DNA glycosylase